MIWRSWSMGLMGSVMMMTMIESRDGGDGEGGF
jgi:hypothetical protein